MSGGEFVSYGRNNEDVVLWRALQRVTAGCYVEVGVKHPEEESATRAFYDRGWTGLTIRPVPQFTTARLDDLLTKSGWGQHDIQFMLIDVEAAEAGALSTIDLGVWRPWVMVIEAIAPAAQPNPVPVENNAAAWERGVLAAGYQFCLFDGVSRFYVADERSQLRPSLSYPACVLDNFTRHQQLKLAEFHAGQLAEIQDQHELEREALKRDGQEATRQSQYWRANAVRSWGTAMAAVNEIPALQKEISALQGETEALQRQIGALQSQIDAARHELAVVKGTFSWRVTAPLRRVRNAQRAIARHAR